MAIASYFCANFAEIFSILNSSDCPVLAAFEKLSENNLKGFANAVHASYPEPIEKLITANHNTKATLAELVYLEDAYRLAQSGEVDQVNQMTDLQLRLVAYSKNILPFKELFSRNSFQIRISLLAMFSCRPALNFETDEEHPKSSEFDTSDDNDEMGQKIILTKNNGAVMRF